MEDEFVQPSLERQSSQSSDAPSTRTVTSTAADENATDQVSPIIHNICPRVLSSLLVTANHNALDWSHNGLIAFGCQNRVIIADLKKCPRICQSLHRHRSAVVFVKWPPDNSLKLASADSSGTIVVWDVIEASVLSVIASDRDTKTIVTMSWVELRNSQNNSKQLYLLVNYSSGNLILYDSELGEVVWKKNFSSLNLRRFEVDPFCSSNVIFEFDTVDCSFSLINDLNSQRCPRDDVKRYQVGVRAATNNTKNLGHLRYSLKLVGHQLEEDCDDKVTALNENYIQILFNKSVRNQVLLVFQREILVIDLLIEAVVCSVCLERNNSNLIQVYSCWQRNAFFAFHDNGSITLRVLQKQPILDEHSGANLMQFSFSTFCQSEGIRMIKQNKLMAFCVSSLDETRFALLLSNGKLIIKSLHKMSSNGIRQDKQIFPFLTDFISTDEYQAGKVEKGKQYKILITSLIPSVSPPPHVIKMCPPVTLKNWPFHKPLLAVGDSSGLIQIWNLSSAILEKEFSIHSCPVRGIEWTSLESILSFAYPNLSLHVGKVNNELSITNIASGRTIQLRTDKNEESSPIELLKVSHLKQYFIIVFKEQPFEIWDLRSLTLLRVMPKHFASMTSLEWSPLYNKKSEKERAQELSEGDKQFLNLSSKENFVTTNTSGELFHFSIEGNIVKEISRIPPDSSSTVTYITWKSDLVVLGDAEGNLNIWDLKKKCSRNESTRRNWIKKIRFGPGRGNMKILVLFNDGVDIWDVRDLKLTAQLKNPRDINFKVEDIDWAGSDRPILAGSDGTIIICDLKLKRFTSTIAELIDEDGHSDDFINYSILPQMSNFIHKSKLVLHDIDETDSKLSRYILVAKLFGDKRSYIFWTIIRFIVDELKLDSYFDYFMDNESFKLAQNEKLGLFEFVKSSHKHSRKICDLHIFLNNKQRAVQLLLETDQNSPNFYLMDALRACLIASLQSNQDSLAAHPVIKLVATNLIANGKIEDGVQLLCLIGKTQDACRYLQSANKWNEAVWLAKCTLQSEEYKEVIRRWCDYLLSQNEVDLALFALLSLKQFIKAIQLLQNYDIEKACFLIDFCISKNFIGVQENFGLLNDIIDKYSKMLKEAGLEQAQKYYLKLLS